jgi:hypothetical protein
LLVGWLGSLAILEGWLGFLARFVGRMGLHFDCDGWLIFLPDWFPELICCLNFLTGCIR